MGKRYKEYCDWRDPAGRGSAIWEVMGSSLTVDALSRDGIGARLQGQFDAFQIAWRPYLRVSVLRSFGSDDKVTRQKLPPRVAQTSMRNPRHSP